jgi:hypothetical protein
LIIQSNDCHHGRQVDQHDGDHNLAEAQAIAPNSRGVWSFDLLGL